MLTTQTTHRSINTRNRITQLPEGLRWRCSLKQVLCVQNKGAYICELTFDQTRACLRSHWLNMEMSLDHHHMTAVYFLPLQQHSIESSNQSIECNLNSSLDKCETMVNKESIYAQHHGAIRLNRPKCKSRKQKPGEWTHTHNSVTVKSARCQ